jgi:DNA transformation protein
MPVTRGFTDFVVEQLEGCGVLSTKRMFGGVGIYCDETFFAIIDDDILYLKADAVNRPELERAGAGPFRPYGDDRASMNYYSVPVAILEDRETLERWGREAIAAAGRKQPAPRRKPAAKRAAKRKKRRF